MAESDKLRVILVGPTGLDARLRFRPGVELVHVASAMDAVGELADPLDADSPDRSVVIVASSRCPSEGPQDLIQALRQLQPSIRVLLCGTNGKDASAFDASLEPDADESTIRAALDIDPPQNEPQAQPSLNDEPVQPSPADVAVPDRVEPAGQLNEANPLALAGDGALVTAMLHGQDVLGIALASISERLGPNVTFVTESDNDGAEVRWHDRVFGWLHAPGIDDQSVAREALWLAGWLRLNEQQSQLREAALTDPLTGAWNRRYFDRFLPVAIERARKARDALSLLVFDIDDFKRFNTEYGHPAGDEILIETVKLLRSTIRPTDRVCRIGGDEFCVIFHEPTGPREPGSRPPDSVYQISKRFQQAICAHQFPKLGLDAPGTLSISGGMATYPWDGRDAKELLEHADQLSLQSKEQGKNAILLGPGAARVCATDEYAD